MMVTVISFLGNVNNKHQHEPNAELNTEYVFDFFLNGKKRFCFDLYSIGIRKHTIVEEDDQVDPHAMSLHCHQLFQACNGW